MSEIDFVLHPVQPFRLDLTVWALRRRPNNMMDRWEDKTYLRTLVLGARPVRVATRQQGGMLSVHVTGARLPSTTRTDIMAALDRLLGLASLFASSSSFVMPSDIGNDFLFIADKNDITGNRPRLESHCGQTFSLKVAV